MEIKCKFCEIEIDESNSWWNEDGFGYSTKLTRCPQCNRLIIIGHIEDSSIDLNKDLRYYEY